MEIKLSELLIPLIKNMRPQIKRNIYIFLLPVIVSVSLILRIINFSQNPPSLNWDEVSHGYNAYSILKTGMDEWGQVFPLSNFRAYGDYPLPLNLYITIPFIQIFGLSSFSIRLPHIILGVLTVFVSYFLGFGITKKKEIAILTALFAAVDPWFVFTSRFVNQANLSIFFLSASMAAFLNRSRSRHLFPLSVLLFGLTLYSYHTTRIFSPLFLIVVLFHFRHEIVQGFRKRRREAVLSAALLLLFLIPLPFIFLNPESRARSKEVFLIDSGAINKIIEKRNNSKLPEKFSSLIYNRPSYFLTKFIGNYLGYFSPQYLFLDGGSQYQFSVPGKGLILPVNLVFFYIGLIVLFIKSFKGDKTYRLILYWLILAPIPASITRESYAVLRSSTMLPIPQILAAIGLYKVFTLVKIKSLFKYILYGVYSLILILCLYCYLKEYFGNYRIKYSQAWQYGYHQIVDYAEDYYDKYDKIIVTKKYGEPHEFYLFFSKRDPKLYQNGKDTIRFKRSDWYWVDKFDKYYFVNDWEIPKEEWQPFILESRIEEIDCRTYRCLLITSPGNVPKKWVKIKSIDFLDGTPAFEIYEN